MAIVQQQHLQHHKSVIHSIICSARPRANAMVHLRQVEPSPPSVRHRACRITFVTIKDLSPHPTSLIPLPVIRNERERNITRCRSTATATPSSAPSFEDVIMSRATSISSANSIPATFSYIHLHDATVVREISAAQYGPSSHPLEDRR